MSKRAAGFKRKPSDFYPTPPEAVESLLPRLKAENFSSFAEPCCGNGALTRALESHGFLKCVYAGDIRRGQDALLRTDFNNAERIITNPPHSRDQMHLLIAHLAGIAPSWLLIDADWMHTKQAAPYLPHCTDIVPIGRVKWFKNSEHTGLDNYCWYRFDAKHKGPTIIHGRAP
jgi:hypothetical protein